MYLGFRIHLTIHLTVRTVATLELFPRLNLGQDLQVGHSDNYNTNDNMNKSSLTYLSIPLNQLHVNTEQLQSLNQFFSGQCPIEIALSMTE